MVYNHLFVVQHSRVGFFGIAAFAPLEIPAVQYLPLLNIRHIKNIIKYININTFNGPRVKFLRIKRV